MRHHPELAVLLRWRKKRLKLRKNEVKKITNVAATNINDYNFFKGARAEGLHQLQKFKDTLAQELLDPYLRVLM